MFFFPFFTATPSARADLQRAGISFFFFSKAGFGFKNTIPVDKWM